MARIEIAHRASRAAPLFGVLLFAGCTGELTDGNGDADGGSGGTAGGPGTTTTTATTTGTSTDTSGGTGTDTMVATGTGTQTGSNTGTGTDTGPVDCGAWPAGQQGMAVGNIFPQDYSWTGYPLGSDTLGTVTAEDFRDCDGSKGINAVMFITAQVS